MVEPGKRQEVAVNLEKAEHFTNQFSMEFVKIPAGEFMMGCRDSPEDEAVKSGRFQSEKKSRDTAFIWYARNYPRHLVRITKPFFMQTTEVTRAQWGKIMNKGEYIEPEFPGKPIIPRRFPKVEKFIKLLNQAAKGKVHYRLPTEAEWEYACRAGTTSPFYIGETISPDQAYYAYHKSPYGDGKKGQQSKKMGPFDVKAFSPNPWGLYDMHGNVDEACSDWLDLFYYSYSPINDPINEETKEGDYILRGGDWREEPIYLTSANRSRYSTLKGEKNYYGIRLVVEIKALH